MKNEVLSKEKETMLKLAQEQLLFYGIMAPNAQDDIEDFLFSFHASPLSHIMVYLKQKEYLPKLKALLEVLSDEDLCFRGENAILWAAGSALGLEKLLLLKECKAHFVAKHLRDKGYAGRTALHYAACGCEDSAETMYLLVQWGADVNARDDALFTPLHELALCSPNHSKRWEALLRCGADPALKEENGFTADEIKQNGIPIPEEWCRVNGVIGGGDAVMR